MAENRKNHLVPLTAIGFIAIGTVALLEKHLPGLTLWPWILVTLGVILLLKRIF